MLGAFCQNLHNERKTIESVIQDFLHLLLTNLQLRCIIWNAVVEFVAGYRFIILINRSEDTIPYKILVFRKLPKRVMGLSVEEHKHGLINYIDTKAKCRRLKKFTCKGTLRQVLICLIPPPPPVLRIHDNLEWIRIRIWIRGSMPPTNGSGSGSCYFRHWPSRWQQKTHFLKRFFANYFLKVHFHHFQR